MLFKKNTACKRACPGPANSWNQLIKVLQQSPGLISENLSNCSKRLGFSEWREVRITKLIINLKDRSLNRSGSRVSCTRTLKSCPPQLWRKIWSCNIYLTHAIWRKFTCGVWAIWLSSPAQSGRVSGYVGSSKPTTQFICVSASKNQFAVTTIVYFCEKDVALAGIAQLISRINCNEVIQVLVEVAL